VPGHDPIEALAAHLTARGIDHDGVHRTPVGWVLLGVHDPDGHEVRFYTVPLELPDSTARMWLMRVLVFQFVCLGWVFFRSPTIHDAFVVLNRLVFHRDGGVDLGVVLVIALMLASQFVPRDVVARMQRAFTRWGLAVQVGALTFVLLLIDVLGPTGIAPFIYFQF